MIPREFYKFLCVAAKLIRPHSKFGVYLVEKDSGYCILGIVETKLAGLLLILLAQPQVKTLSRLSFGTSYVGYNFLLK